MSHWAPPSDYVCFVRVELDFIANSACVWINGRPVGSDLPISPPVSHPDDFDGRELRLERWAFTSPGNYEGYRPAYTDIDDLEFGTWESPTSTATPAASQATVARNGSPTEH
jgi:hypothetical protein